MAYDFPLQQGRDLRSKMAVGKEDSQGIEQEITRLMLPQSENLSGTTAAPVDVTTASNSESLDPGVATESFLSFLLRVSSEAAQKCANAVATRLTLKDAKETGALSLENSDGTMRPQPQDPFPDASDANQDDRRHGDSIVWAFGRGNSKITSDDDSTSSSDSEDSNEYNIMAWVEGHLGRAGEVLISVDPQAPTDFIVRPTLNDLNVLGEFKEHSIPGKLKSYTSPLSPKGTITPTKFVDMRLDMDAITERLEARLIVLEVPEAPSGFQVILGRKTIGKLGDWRFLRRVVEAYAAGATAVASVDNSFAAPIRRATNKSKKKIEDDRAKYTALQERKYREHAELYGDEYTMSARFSMQSPCNGGSSDWGGSQPTGYHLLSPNCAQPAAWQANELPELPRWPIQRVETSSTQSTQHTQYSFQRQDTASSASSWPSSVQAYAPAEGAMEALAAEKTMGVASAEEEDESERV